MRLFCAQVTALEAEVLEGANQYACESCQCKVDATRQMVLRTLPPYLCIQLNRFVFDLEVGQCTGGNFAALEPAVSQQSESAWLRPLHGATRQRVHGRTGMDGQ